ncbi:MAG: hypothetical protein H7A51_10735 [Akkermansiaceae bacterium]|nr:hypothetical protein [Akkermansiaceae bacterium]
MNTPLIVRLPVITCLALAGCGTPSSDPALTRGPSMETGEMAVANQPPDIFTTYNASGRSRLSQGWTSKFDASGISFNDKRTCTLITPRHVVMAKHYTRPLFRPVVFHDRRGKRAERQIVSVKYLTGDVAVGLLDEALPANFTPYPVLRPSPDLASRLVNGYALVTDQNRRIFVHQVAAIRNGAIAFKFDVNKKNGYYKKLVSGDSGNPSFVMRRGHPVLIETHTGGGPGLGPFYGDASVQAEIARAIAETDKRYSLRKVAW